MAMELWGSDITCATCLQTVSSTRKFETWKRRVMGRGLRDPSTSASTLRVTRTARCGATSGISPSTGTIPTPHPTTWRSSVRIVTGLATNSIFFCFLFLWKLIDLPGGQINDPSSGKHYCLPFLPATPSSPSWTLEGLFELKQCISRALDLPPALLPEP